MAGLLGTCPANHVQVGLALVRAPALPAQSSPGEEVSEGGRSPLPSWLALLGGRLGGRLGEVVVIGHPPADVGVGIPLHGAGGEDTLRLDDLLEERVLGGLLVCHGVEDVELLLEDGI